MPTRNLFGEAERIAGRAASAGTRHQDASISRAFGDEPAGELDRKAVDSDHATDVAPLSVDGAGAPATSTWTVPSTVYSWQHQPGPEFYLGAPRRLNRHFGR